MIRTVLGVLVLVLAIVTVAISTGNVRDTSPDTARGPLMVRWVVDGDTVTVVPDGGVALERVRLVGVDAPEAGPLRECWPGEATGELAALLPPGSRVWLVADPAQGERDRYGRLLGYLEDEEGLDVALVLVEAGAVRPVGRHPRGEVFEQAAAQARGEGRGLWGAGSPRP